CGLLITTEGRTVLSIKGDPDNALSRGHICPKATAITDLQDDPDRLRVPVKRVGDTWQEISWETAFAEIAARAAQVLGEGGAASVYVGNPTAHNYSVGGMIGHLKRAVGARSMFSASTVDQIPHQLVQMWMYGHNGLFPVADIDNTQTMLILGANPLASNGSVWTVPDVRKRLEALQARGGMLIVVDPRRTETAKIADTHHFIRPGGDTALLLALLLALDEAGLVDPRAAAPLLDDSWATAWAALRAFDVATCATACGIDEATIRSLAARLGNGEPAAVYGRMGVSVTRFGSLNHWLIQLLNIASGNFDRVGGVMFGQPAGDIVATAGAGTYGRFHSRVSGHPEILSEFPVVALAEEILTPGAGQIDALFVIAGNPVLSTPDGTNLDRALAQLKLMVSVDMYITATARHAHYILPPCGPLEKDHYPTALAPIMIRNFAAYSPAVFDQTPGSKSDWEIVAELARAIAQARGLAVPNIMHPREALDRLLQRSPRGLSLADIQKHPHGLDLGPLQPTGAEKLATTTKRINAAPPLLVADLDRFAAWLDSTAAPAGDTLQLFGRRHVRNNNSW
ncbi:MAG: molybdopterin-dependent oxidoreductase, partial [Polymorphobacter sp.]